MLQKKGFQAYKNYWEDQAKFMSIEPWSRDKIMTINIFPEYHNELEKLGFSNHAKTNTDKNIIIHIKIPLNYFQMDNFESKVLQLLGIQQDWLMDSSIDNSQCKSPNW